MARDRHVLDTLGLSFVQVADRLEVVLGRAERMFQLARRMRHGMGHVDEDGANVAMIEPELKVRAWHFAGYQDCPFDDDEGHPCPKQPWASADYELTHTTSGMKVKVPGLLPHLIRAHSFFEGDVPHRVAPEQLAQVLTLNPDSHAVPEWRTERVWRVIEIYNGLPWLGIGGPRWYWKPTLMELLGYGGATQPQRWDERVEFAPAVTASRAGDWCVLVARTSGTLAQGAPDF